MNLFRSEEHVKNWLQYKPETEGGIVPLDKMVKLFSGNFFRKRMDQDWVTRSGEYGMEMAGAAKELGPFWQF